MRLTEYILIVNIFSAIAVSGCAGKNIHAKTDSMNSSYITITGVAGETKDGYYVAGYVLEHEEIYKYYNGNVQRTLRNRKLEITGRIKEVNIPCPKYKQCRKGPYKVIYDLKSIRIIE